MSVEVVETATASTSEPVAESDGYSQCAYCKKFKPMDQYALKTSGQRALTCKECAAKKQRFYAHMRESREQSMEQARSMFDETVWKPHPKYKRYAANRYGCIIDLHSGRIQGSVCTHQYIKLTIKDGDHVVYPYAHRIVYECFHGLIPEDDTREICHNDSNRANNAIDNLRLDTHQANMSDRAAAQTELHNSFQSRASRPVAIKARLQEGRRQDREWCYFTCVSDAARETGVDISDVYDSANERGQRVYGGYMFQYNRKG